MKDYYRILDVKYDSSPEEIEIAYKLAYNRVTNENSGTKEGIEEAYRVLSDPEMRKEYDQTINMFSKDSEVLINVSYLNLSKELMADKVTNDDEIREESYHHDSSFERNPRHRYLNYKNTAIGFGILSICLLLMLLFQKSAYIESQGRDDLIMTPMDRNLTDANIVYENNSNENQDSHSTWTENEGSRSVANESNRSNHVANQNTTNQKDLRNNNTIDKSNNISNNSKDSYSWGITNELSDFSINNTANQYESGKESLDLISRLGIEYTMHKASVKTKTPNKPKILYKTEKAESYEAEDRFKWVSLVHDPRYLLKDPYPELKHEEKVEKLRLYTEEFFDRALMMEQQEGLKSTIKDIFLENSGEISYLVANNTAYMIVFMPALYVAQNNNDVLQEEIFLFVMYELSIVDGEVYGIFTPMNPFTIYVTSRFFDLSDIRLNQYPAYQYISVETARSTLNNMLEDKVDLNLMETSIVKKDLKDSYLQLYIPTPDESTIEKYKKEYGKRDYEYMLYDPYEDLTEEEKIELLNENPEQFFDAVLTGIQNKHGVSFKELLQNGYTSWEYHVENNRAFMYITTPIMEHYSDGYNVHSLQYYQFILYEIAVFPDGVYAKYEITNPYLLLIKDKYFFQNLSPEEFNWEYLMVLDINNTNFLLGYYRNLSEKWAYTSEVEKLTIQAIVTP